MIPPLNFRGYTASDPLDRAPTAMSFVITMAVSGIVALIFLYVGSQAYPTYKFEYPWMYWVGVAIYTFIMGALLTALRKSSSVLFYLMIVVISVPLDIFLQAHYRDQGQTAWWMYPPGSFLSPIPVPLKFLVAWSFDGIIQGPLALWFARLVASVIYPSSRAKAEPTPEQRRALFPEQWTTETLSKPPRDAGFWLLRLLGLGYLAYLIFCLIGALGSSVWPEQARQLIVMTYQNPALGINTFSKISLMVVLAFIGAYNRNLRFHATIGLLTGHLVSTVASLAFYFWEPATTDYHSFLLTSAVTDGVMVLIFIWIIIRYRADGRVFAPERPVSDFTSLPDQLTKWLFGILTVIFILMIPVVVLLRVFGDGTGGLSAVYGYPDPQIGNTITKFATMAALAFLLVDRQRLREHLIAVLILGLVITLAGTSLFVLIGGIAGKTGIVTRGGGTTTVDWYFMLEAALDGLALFLIIGLRKMVYNIDYVINALNPSSAQSVVALHEAVYGGGPVENGAILDKIDRHVAGIQGRKRGLLNFPFWIVEQILSPLYWLHPTYSNMSREERRHFLRKYVLRTPEERASAFIPALADLAYKIGQAVHAFVTFAHYTYEKGWQDVGYIPPDARDRLQADFPSSPPPFKQAAPLPDGPGKPWNDKPDHPKPPHPLVALRVSTPVAEPAIPEEVDYLIVGSGAGGACMAYRLACAAGDPSRILVVDRGPRFSPLQDFNDDEMQMIRKLYKEGGLQQSKRFDLMVLQGECVGGTTVINNAVCLMMPQQIRDLWHNEYNLDLSDLEDEYSRIAEEIEITPIPDAAINTIVKARFFDGVDKYNGAVAQSQVLNKEHLSANQRDMIGDGLCNLGNKRLRKRSMLETYIPWAEGRGVRVVGGTSAVCFIADRNRKRAESVVLRTSQGSIKKVAVRKAVIAAGGVIASSHFLMRSGIDRNVGSGMSCNFAFPVAFEFADRIDAFDGTQITLGAFDPANRAAFETYFNPPGAFALSQPFYFERLEGIMNRYRWMVNFGALVGSEPNGVIELKSDPLTGRPFTWELGETDRQNIKYALGTLADIGQRAGALRCVLPTEPGLDIPLSPDSVASFKKALEDYPLQMSDLRLTTAHPQGGNRMMGDASPHRTGRAIDSQFRVDGFENVFVADASVFPTGITVNPQWTIMALSSIAAKRVLSLK